MSDLKLLRQITIGLLILLIISPLLSTLGMVVFGDQSQDAQQFSLVQVIVMAIYNIPCLAISGAAFLLADSRARSGKHTSALWFLGVSVVASVIGSILMLAWGVGA
jgi:amino acid transporter